MKILILGGFLGSGKTTILLQLAEFLVNGASQDKKCSVAIIENEIGQVGIDDQLLKGQGYTVREIFSGCVCCSLSSDLLSGINEIKESFNPDWVIIEATGVAFPDKIAETLETNLDLKSRIVTLVDASRWKRIRIPLENLIYGQLSGADCILINKIDLVSQEELQTVKNEVAKLNATASFFAVSILNPLEQNILEVIKNG